MAQVDPLQTFSDEYVKLPRHRVTIDNAEGSRLFVFDPFHTDHNLFSMTDLNMTVGMGQTGSFNFTIDDSLHRVIDREELDVGCFVTIDSGRDENHLTRMITGPCPTIQSDRIGRPGFIYKFSGIGRESVLANILMNVTFSAAIDPTTNQFIMAEEHKSKNVIRDIFTNPNYMIPSSKKFNAQTLTLQQLTGVSLAGISNDLNDPIFQLDFNQTSASQILSSIEDQLNIDIFMDPDGVLTAKYPTALHSGMVIKTEVEEGDSAENIGYVEEEHSYSDSISSSEYASHLVTTGKVTSNVEGSTSQSGYLDLYNKDIGQQIPVSALRFENLAVIIQRVGAGTNNANPLTYRASGSILEDDADAPSSKVITTFSIPVTKIPTNPTSYNVSQFVKKNVVADTSKKYWLVMYEVGSNHENTIRWYHDNSIGKEVKQYPNAIKPLPGGRHSGNVAEKYDAYGWRVNWTGPTYSYLFQSKDSHEMLMKNPSAVKRWGRKDARVSTLQQGISDSGSMFSALASMLENSSSKERTYSFDRVIIPKRFFMPSMVVNFVDPPVGLTSRTNYTLTIQEVSYKQSSNDPGSTKYCSITAYKKLRPNEKFLKTRDIMI
jgi:hypothetical protein